eukprot:gene8994-9955_t
MVAVMEEEPEIAFESSEKQTSINGDEEIDEELDDAMFEDPEGFVDDITDEELLGDVLKERPKKSDGLDSIVIVDNVPVVGPERLEKLKNVIKKIFSKFGKIVSEYYPEENGSTKGYIFLEFSNPEDAAQAVKMASGYQLDKKHIFDVNAFADFTLCNTTPETWTPPDKLPYVDQGNLKSWLLEKDCNDQFCIIYSGGQQVAVYKNKRNGPEVLKERPGWTETYVQWSPNGTYLATLHQKGIAVWGGSDFRRIQRFQHTGVQLLDFSPCERYIVTYSPPRDPSDVKSIVFWDIRTGAEKRAFAPGESSQWPVFKWSHKGEYFARVGNNNLSVYETPSFGLLDKKSIKIANMKDFTWSPSGNLIAYWVPEDKDTPARLVIMEMPIRQERRSKNLFNVASCKMYWQKNGNFLAVRVERYTKSKKAVFSSLELFRTRSKDIPVDTLEIKEPIIDFEWEPNGSKFVVIHGESSRISASFYNIEEGDIGKVAHLKTFERKQLNCIFWSPIGQFVLLAGLKSYNGVLEFYDTGDMTLLNACEHFMASDVQWDPTGRYVTTSVSWWGHKVDNAYNIWSFQGRLLQTQSTDQLCQFLWRPRPKCLLSDDDLKELKKNFKKYQKMFEAEDLMKDTEASKEIIDRRRALYKEFSILREELNSRYNDFKDFRIQLRGMETDSLYLDTDIEEETIEFFIKEEIEVIEKEE